MSQLADKAGKKSFLKYPLGLWKASELDVTSAKNNLPDSGSINTVLNYLHTCFGKYCTKDKINI